MRRPTLVLALMLVGALAASGWILRDRLLPGCPWSERPPLATVRAELVLFGDSHVCAGDWDRRLGGSQVAWWGHRGATSARLAGYTGYALEFEPRRIVLLAGTNDVIQGRTPEAFETDYRRIVAALSPGRGLALVTLPPCTSQACDHPLQQARLGEINRRIAAIARERGAALLDLHAALEGPDPSRPRGLAADGIHLSESGYRRFAGLVANWLAEGGQV